MRKPCDAESIPHLIKDTKAELISHANSGVGRRMYERGGGVRDIQVRTISDSHSQNKDEYGTSIDVFVDTCDAMGANIITQICESLRKPIEQLTGQSVLMAIVSNCSDRRLFKAHVVLRDIDPIRADYIVQAQWYALNDPYRAPTHNKGIMNAVDAILVATGNDWRAAEAAAHSYAARTGQYRSLSTWLVDENILIGELTLPLPVGVIGGVTRVHPTAVTARKLADIHSADELGQIATAVGLIQNLAALDALVNGGLTQGHMKLHIPNLIEQCGVPHELRLRVEQILKDILSARGTISQADVKTALDTVRNGHHLS